MIGTMDALVNYDMIPKQGFVFKRSASCPSLAELHSQICLVKKAKLLGQYPEEEECPGNSDESLLHEEEKSSEELSVRSSSGRSLSEIDNQVILLSEGQYSEDEDSDEELLKDYDYIIMPLLDGNDSDPYMGMSTFVVPPKLYDDCYRHLKFVTEQRELEGEILKAPNILKLIITVAYGVASFFTFEAENVYGARKTFRAKVWESLDADNIMALEYFASKPDCKSSKRYDPTEVFRLEFNPLEDRPVTGGKMSRKTMARLVESSARSPSKLSVSRVNFA